MTAGERLRALAGVSGTAGTLLLRIGSGATASAILVDYSGLPTATAAVHLMTDVVITNEHHGKGDNDGRKHHRNIVKPTGLSKHKNATINKLVKEQQEVVSQVVKGLSKAPVVKDDVEVIQMSLAEIDFEIKTLLHKQFRTQEDEAMLLILLAANI